MDLIIRPSSHDTIAIALGGKLKGIKVKRFNSIYNKHLL